MHLWYSAQDTNSTLSVFFLSELTPFLDIGTMEGTLSSQRLADLRAEISGGGAGGSAEDVTPLPPPTEIAKALKRPAAGSDPVTGQVRGSGASGVNTDGRGKGKVSEFMTPAPAPPRAAAAPPTSTRIRAPAEKDTAADTGGGKKKAEKKKKQTAEDNSAALVYFSDDYYKEHVDSGYVFGKDARFRVFLPQLEVSISIHLTVLAFLVILAISSVLHDFCFIMSFTDLYPDCFECSFYRHHQVGPTVAFSILMSLNNLRTRSWSSASRRSFTSSLPCSCNVLYTFKIFVLCIKFIYCAIYVITALLSCTM